MTPTKLITIPNPCIELRRCGVKPGMTFEASQDLFNSNMWFNAPDHTLCVVSKGDYTLVAQKEETTQ